MDTTIRDEEIRHLADELAALTGENIYTAVSVALRERLARERQRQERAKIADALMDLGRRYAALPDRDTRDPDSIIGYDEHGLPT